MKIHSIHITNIASLKGEHRIDFDQFQADHGSFAITGDTGAGKSTILNCVSLALYGKSYKGLNQGDFVTLGESSAKVELVFSVAGTKYLSIWGCRTRKKNGEYLKTPTHTKEFYQFNENNGDKEILETVPEDVVGLNFDQFCKTVILNQGEFARFLSSTFRERKDILEKLYQGRKLDQFNPALRAKITEHASKVAEIEAKMDGLGQGIQSEVNREGLEILETEFALTQSRWTFVEKATSELKDVQELDAKNGQTKLRLSELESKIQGLSEKLNRQKVAQGEFYLVHDAFKTRLKELSPALHQAIEWEKNLEGLRSELLKSQKAGNDFSRLAAQEEDALKKSRARADKARAELSALEADPTFMKLSDQDLSKLTSLFQSALSLRSEIESERTLIEHLQKAAKELAAESAVLKNELEAAKERAEELERDETGLNLEQTEKAFYKLQQLSADHKGLLRDTQRLLQEADHAREQLKSKRKTVGELEKRKVEIHELIKVQKDAIKGAKLQNAAAICAQESLERGECVVCSGSELSSLSLEAVKEEAAKIIQYEEKLASLEKESEDLFQDLERARTSQSALQANAIKLKEATASITGEFIAANFDLLKSLDLDEKNLEVGQDIISQRINETKAKMEKGKERRLSLNTLKEKAGSLQIRIAENEAKALKQKAELASKKERARARQKDFDAGLNEIKAICKIAEFDRIRAFLELSQRWSKANSELEKILIDEAHTKERLKTACERRDVELERSADCQERIEQVNQKILQIIAKVQEGASSLGKETPNETSKESPKESLKRLEKEAEIFEFKRKKIEEELKNLEIEKSSQYSRRQTLSEQLKDQENLLLAHWSEFKEAVSGEPPVKSEELGAMLSELSQLDTLCPTEALEVTTQLFQKEKDQTKADLDREREKLTEYRTLLKKQNEAKEKLKQLRQEREKALILKSEWEELHLLVGKDEFRNYILAMVEKALIQQTNRELSKLCDGRYLIQHKQASSRLAPDFYIIDKFRGDESRKVSTLSGGETFMVSLAMAMALAELTRGSADIDSFFIDEGFGTLDQDSLEEALDMLQDIETRGKQIGLISHVKELTQRIPVNIHLVKNRLGNSSVEIVYN